MFRLIKFLYQKKKFKRIMLLMISSILVFALLYFISGKFATQYLNEKENLSFFNALYFSIVTQSTVGYGDLVPTNVLTKSITMLQLLTIVAIIGMELD
jgi:voltage-gated potassium channel